MTDLAELIAWATDPNGILQYEIDMIEAQYPHLKAIYDAIEQEAN